ncbi:MAG: formate dehydrogenase accessory sulfurtransferase FdhD [Planctomycetota bacterium]|nr:formate dehydrogenase accessory sulfurtransferase FdhD [Planctomycetota bacterium]
MSPRPPSELVPHQPVPVTRVEEGGARTEEDAVVIEAPLEVRLGERSLLMTMRTPGDDFDLVRGLLFTEGLVADPADVAGVAWCPDVPEESKGHIVIVSLREGAVLDESRTVRAGLVSSGCGLCGKATLEAVTTVAPPVQDGPPLTRELLTPLPSLLRGGQSIFDRTGGLHAAGLFSSDGTLLSLKEDVGRHNAVDKVIGEALRFGQVPLEGSLLMTSGRAGFEIVQKARMAGIPVVCSVSAPSSLAVDLAVDGGQTLVGFLRDGRFNVYAGENRFEPPLDG